MSKKVRFLPKKVHEIMTHGVIAVDKTLDISNACAHMVRGRMRGLLVLSEGRFEGIVTASDIISKVIIKGKQVEKLRVEEVMSSPLITVDYDASIEEACKMMMKRKIRHLPVVRGKSIVGMITPTDVLRGVEFKG